MTSNSSIRRTTHSPRTTRRKRSLSSCLFLTLGAGLGFVALVSLVGPSWLMSRLDTTTTQHHPFLFSSLDDSTLENKDPFKYTSSGKRIRKMEKKVAAQVKDAGKVKSCRRFQKPGDQAVFGPKCLEQLKLLDHAYRSVVIFNPASFQRFWCGHEIPAKRIVTLTEREARDLCKEPPQMSKVKPTVEGTDMPPIQLLVDGGQYFDLVDRALEPFPCDIPCERSGFADVLQYYKPRGMNVTITYSMESAQHYTELEIDDYAYRRNVFYATTSSRSDIPLPYFSFAEYNISDPAVDYDSAIRGASFMARNCESMSNREEIVQNLMKAIRVDSLSECLHNAERPKVEDDGGLGGKIAVMRAYLFHLAFENSNEDDYITEKLWGTLQSGTLPIYYGAPNVLEHAPAHSIISYHDFGSTEKLAQYINKVANDKELYDSYHEWRRKPLPESFRKKFNFTNTHSVCRMCRWAYAKKYGFGWDHSSQTVQKLALPRDVKYDTNAKVIEPFQESWLLPSNGWERRIYEHDGVIDIHFEPLPQGNSSTVYRMETPLRGEFRAGEMFHRHMFTLQNRVSRMTVVTSWEAKVESPEPNMIDMTLDKSFDLLRVRVILEDVDTFHKDADKVPTYFGEFMAKDFLVPLEAFLLERKRSEIETAAQ